MPLSSAMNVIENVDDFGKPIGGKDVYGHEIPVAQQAAGYLDQVTAPVLPQYIRNPIQFGAGRQNAEQAIAGTVESPLRYAKAPKPKGRSRRRSRSRSR
jgi:hypothetical protein